MNYRCPICNGKGTVESEFGGGTPYGPRITCPGCKGTGMQYKPEDPPTPFNPCPKPYKPWKNPLEPNPWKPCPPSPFDPWKIPKKRRRPFYFPNYRIQY
jgi:hypothetical protein